MNLNYSNFEALGGGGGGGIEGVGCGAKNAREQLVRGAGTLKINPTKLYILAPCGEALVHFW